MMCRTGDTPDPAESGRTGQASTDAAFSALLEDSAEELYEAAPCGYLSTLMDGTIAKINATLLRWLGLERDAVVGRMRFADLLTVGGRLYHETHFAPLLRMRGEVNSIALELRTAGGGRLPVLISSHVKLGSQGEPLLIRTTVFDASDRRAYEEELLRGRQEAERAREQAESDRARLADALAVLQQSLVPTALPDIPGLESAVHYHAASPEQLGGDFYDLFPVDGTRWAFFLGDVCGKGPEAAALTSLTRYTLRAAAVHDPEPAAALSTLNAVLHERYAAGGDPRFCTCIFGILEPGPAPGRFDLRLASGGHPSALALRADGTAELLPTPGGMLIGVVPDAPIATARTTLSAGETLLLYTDGLTEARTGAGHEGLFGEEALVDFAADLAPAAPAAVVASVTRLLEGFGDGLTDDTAVLALGVPGPTGGQGGRP